MRKLLEPLLDRRRRVADLVEEVLSFGRDTRDHVTAVVLIPLPADEPRLLEPVEQPRHVRNAIDHALADLAAAEAVGSGAAQDAEYVELGPSQPERPERLVGRVIDDGRSPKQPQDCLVLEAGEGLGLLDLGL